MVGLSTAIIWLGWVVQTYYCSVPVNMAVRDTGIENVTDVTPFRSGKSLTSKGHISIPKL